MKRVKKPVFFVIAAIILFLSCTSIFGIHVTNGDVTTTYIKGLSDIRWGIDIRGGVEATFSPANGYVATQDELNSAKSIIELRMVNNNITDYEIYTDSGNNRIIVRFPWKSDETNFDPQSAINELSATALLTFRAGDSYENTSYDSNGNEVHTTPSGDTASTILLSGSDVTKATAQMTTNSTTGSYQYVVALEFSDEGTQKFADATTQYNGKVISIWMDDVMISAPTVNAVITDGKAVIEGNFTATTASELANKIQGGALPFALETSNFSSINPTLGLSSLDAMKVAGLIAFALIAVFMILIFRLPGFVATLTLAGQMAITFASISGYLPFVNSFTMTLPGIAGIILSIGMGVDANIITASRIKEELATGKTLDGAVSKGCANSFWSIFDGNITIIIVAIMLIGVFGPGNILSAIFGESTTGSIYSFGYTLLVGVIGNFIMGVFCSRKMLKSMLSFKIFHKKWLYGGAKNDEQV
jgi:protein-export membrane protein SecD